MSDLDLDQRQAQLDKLLDEQQAVFTQRNGKSLAELRKLVRHLPLAVATSYQSHFPFPLVMDHGAGQYITDVDGNEYLDLHGGFGANVCGHAHPAITEAIVAQVRRGTHLSSPFPELGELTRLLCDRFDMDQVRFCNSGTEATMDAIRLARAYTGRELIVKVEGSYHGHHPAGMVSVKPDVDVAGPDHAPEPYGESEGITRADIAAVRPIVFGDLDGAWRALEDEQAACLILEPVMCNLGMIFPPEGYLDELQEMCDQTGTVLIFDQVKTGATLAPGGVIDLYGVVPDLQCLGKAIGGGTTIGAFGGRAAIMRLIQEGKVPHYGTFSGNPLSVTAGLVGLRDVMTESTYERVGDVGDRMIAGAQALIDAHDLPVHAVNVGCKGGVLFSPRPCRSYRDWLAITNSRIAQLYWVFMANEGIWLPPGGDEQWLLPAPITEEDGDRWVAAFGKFVEFALPLWPDLPGPRADRTRPMRRNF